MKKVFLIFLLVTVFLQGCSRTPGQTVTPAAPLQATITPLPSKTSTRVPKLIEVDEKDLRGLQIHFLHPWSGETEMTLFRLVDEFNQSNKWGIHVIADAPGSTGLMEQETWEGLLNNVSANVVASPTAFLMAVDQKYNNVIDLNEYIFSRNYELEPATRDDFYPRYWLNDEANGKRYAVPAQRTASILLYNYSWAKELGFLTPPATPEDFSRQVCAANASMRKDSDTMNDGIGGWLISTDAPVMMSWLYAFGATPFTNGKYHFNDDVSKEVFTYLLGLVKKSCFWSGRLNQPYAYFANRQTLVYSGYLQDLQTQATTNARRSSTDEWGMIPYPSVSSGTVVTSGISYGILGSKPESDLAAWIFIRWLSAPAQQARLLQSTGTLPLGRSVMDFMVDYAATYPAWKQAIESINNSAELPVDADWAVVARVLEDAGWQLMKTGVTEAQIPAILAQIDDLVLELSERYP